jgi:hypothetical protein
MPRPKIPGTETIQTFNCSYALKTGLFRCAEVTNHSNPSSLIRAELEESCRRILGDAKWKELLRVAQEPERMDARLNQRIDSLKKTSSFRTQVGNEPLPVPNVIEPEPTASEVEI